MARGAGRGDRRRRARTRHHGGGRRRHGTGVPRLQPGVPRRPRGVDPRLPCAAAESEEIRAELGRLQVLVDKTAGVREREAMAYVRAWSVRDPVEAPARLHLGMLAVGDAGTRRFGGFGVAVERPAVVIEAEPADELSVEGADAERALAFAQRCCQALGLAGGAQLRVVEAIPSHVGLGSGTKLALAVAQALAAIHERTVDAPALAQAAGRAARSAVGMWTFALGGLVVEGGVRGEGSAPLLTRHAMPDEWRIVIVVPNAEPGISGQPRRRRSSGSCRRPSDRRPSRSSCSRRCCRHSSRRAGGVRRRADARAAARGGRVRADAGRSLPSASGCARRGTAAWRGGGSRPEFVGTGGLRGGRQRGGRA